MADLVGSHIERPNTYELLAQRLLQLIASREIRRRPAREKSANGLHERGVRTFHWSRRASWPASATPLSSHAT